jgi:hypothetical protein
VYDSWSCRFCSWTNGVGVGDGGGGGGNVGVGVGVGVFVRYILVVDGDVVLERVVVDGK